MKQILRQLRQAPRARGGGHLAAKVKVGCSDGGAGSGAFVCDRLNGANSVGGRAGTIGSPPEPSLSMTARLFDAEQRWSFDSLWGRALAFRI